MNCRMKQTPIDSDTHLTPFSYSFPPLSLTHSSVGVVTTSQFLCYTKMYIMYSTMNHYLT